MELILEDLSVGPESGHARTGLIEISKTCLTGQYCQGIMLPWDSCTGTTETSVNYCGPVINCNGLIITKLNFKVNYQTKSGLIKKVRNRLMMGTEKPSSQNREIGEKPRS